MKRVPKMTNFGHFPAFFDTFHIINFLKKVHDQKLWVQFIAESLLFKND